MEDQSQQKPLTDPSASSSLNSALAQKPHTPIHIPPHAIALVDCNSFYCSCERLFNPRLRNKPVVVLSNNDGCIVSLTPEAKELGIPMGAPIFKVKELVEKHNVAVYSSNYTLYGDISARVMHTLGELAPQIEIYSIDEAFLDLSGFNSKFLSEHGHAVRNTVYQYTAIPVSVGIAPTKVLAKMCNKLAKKKLSPTDVKNTKAAYPTLAKTRGAVSYFDFSKSEIDAVMRAFPVEDLWGIGKQSAKKLAWRGVRTAYDLKNASEKMVRSELTVVGLRILRELNEEPCMEMELDKEPRKQIISSRSFGELQTELDPILDAVSNHATRVCEKLRKQQSVCFNMSVFLHTNPFKQGSPQYYNSRSVEFPNGVNETNVMIRYARLALEQIYRDGFQFKKCGIIVNEIHPETENQLDLFAPRPPDVPEHDRLKAVISTMDRINAELGTDMVKFASCGLEKHWQMKSQMKSRRYTTHWKELLEVK
jgi:DNA polymerase V